MSDHESLDTALMRALDTVIDPELRKPITEVGMVDSATVSEGVATVAVLLHNEGCPLQTT